MPPPINGQQNSMNPVMLPPVRLPQNQQYAQMYNVQNQFQVPVIQNQAPPRDELINSQMDLPKSVAGFEQTLPQNLALESIPYKIESQNIGQGAQPFVQEQNMLPNPMQQPRGQTLYQSNFGGQRMYAKNAHGIQHVATVPNTMSYGVVTSGQMQGKISTTVTEFPGQRMV